MSNVKLLVRNCEFSAALSGSYDIGIGVIGYEARASYCPGRFRAGSALALALRYGNRMVRHFKKNNAELEAHDYDVFDLDSGNENFTAEFVIKEAIAAISADAVRIIVDISSMSRTTMAGVFAAIMGSQKMCVDVTFTYAVALFEKPPRIYPPLVEFGAVDAAFGGAPRGADKFTALILGVGYERGRAIAAYNRVEAEESWILLPLSRDARYNNAVEAANRDLLNLSKKVNALEYDVYDPLFLYEKIRTLALGLRRDHRVVVIPSGPKVCALMTFLVAIDLHPDVSVWRMSS